MALFCQFCYSSGRHKSDCPDVAKNYDEERRYRTFEPLASKPSAHGVDWGSFGDDGNVPGIGYHPALAKLKEQVASLHPAEIAERERRASRLLAKPLWKIPDPVAHPPKEPEYDSMADACAAIKEHHDKRGLPPIVQAPIPIAEAPMPEPAQLIAIDNITGQVYRSLRYVPGGVIGLLGGDEHFILDNSYDVDFE